MEIAPPKPEQQQEDEENVDYQTASDEEDTLPSVGRRKEASDDEEGRGGEEVREIHHPARVLSDTESDRQGGVDEEEIEDDEEEEEEEEEVEEEEEEEEEGIGEKGEGGYDEAGQVAVVVNKKSDWNDWGSDGEEEAVGDSKNQIEEEEEEEQEEDKEKEKEPFAVPKTGAFYMHDDRFGDRARNRNRPTSGGRKLWETADNQKWGHDKFEEINLQQTNYGKEKMSSKSRYGGQNKNRVMKPGNTGENRFSAYDDNGNQNHASKVVKGRGPRRYKSPSTINNRAWPTRYNQSRKSQVTASSSSSGRVSTNVNVQSEHAAHKKHVFASSLNSASLPFYPSGSSNTGSSPVNMHKRDVRAGSTNRNAPSSIEIEKSPQPQAKAFLQGKSVSVGEPNGSDRFHSDKSISQVSTKLTNLQMQPFGSSPVNMHSRGQGRGSTVKGQLSYQSTSSRNHDNKVFAQSQMPVVQQRPIKNPVQPSFGISNEQLGLHEGGGSQSSSPKTQSGNSSESGEAGSPPGPNKFVPALDGKGKNIVQGSGRGSFLFNGAHVFGAGNMGIPHGDHNFPATPLFQVMQFGGQHPSGLGVPAVGMAPPGYMAQPPLGFPNAEVTWLPPLAAAASALSASYPPSQYIAMEDGYSSHHPVGQAPSSGISSREMSASRTSNTWKPPQRTEFATDESVQRQNKPRRYSEMNFGQ